MKRRTEAAVARAARRTRGPAPLDWHCLICKASFRSAYERKRHCELSAGQAGTDASLARGVVVTT
jgi:hypothetical protein